MTPQSTLSLIPLENIFVDLQNPRYDPLDNQREALATIANEQGTKLVSLAKDIVERGLNPSEVFMVTAADDGKSFTVMEGNRRIAALKLVTSSSLLQSLGLEPRLTKEYKALHDQVGANVPRQVFCTVLSREEAKHWIALKHTGENEGVGVVMWDGRARQRFRGSSPALQAIELVEASDYLDAETKEKLPKVSITNIERLLNTPDARAFLGIDVKSNQLVLRAPEEEALARLAMVVADIAHRRVRVSHLDTKDQRVAYAQDVAKRPLLQPAGTGDPNGSKTSPTTNTKATAPAGRRINPDRKTLIPKRIKLVIPHTRINRIYYELQRMSVEEFVNACAVMLRVFVELSIDDFAERKGVTLKIARKPKPGEAPQMRDMQLREKINAIIEHMELTGLCSKSDLRGIKTIYNNHDHVLSVDSLNAYVHNKSYSPAPSDLKTTWDNIEVFVQKMWQA